MLSVDGNGGVDVSGDRRIAQTTMVTCVSLSGVRRSGHELEEPGAIHERSDLSEKGPIGTSRHEDQMERTMTVEPIDSGDGSGQCVERRPHVVDERRIAGRGIERLSERDRFEDQTNGVDLEGQIVIDRCDTSTALRRQFDETLTGQTTDRLANGCGRQAPSLGQMFDRNAISWEKATRQDLVAKTGVGQLGPRRRTRRSGCRPTHSQNL